MPTIKAPMPGVLYHRSSPDAAPYVTEGSAVVAGQTIALIEVMKTFNEVKADRAFRISRILLSDGDEVEAGQDMFEVDEA